MAYRLSPDETLADGVRRVMGEQLEHAAAQLGATEPPTPEAVHEARKACKKLRGALRLVRDSLGDAAYRRENHLYRDAARRLAPVRDSAVLIETLQGLADPSGSSHPFPALQTLLRDAHRRTRQETLVAGTAVPEALRVLQEGRRALADWPLAGSEFSLIEGGLRRVYRRGRRALERCGREPTAENFHEWRKRVKYLWYHCRLLEPTWQPLLEATGTLLHRLSDNLGDHHDLVVLRDRAGQGDVARTVPPRETRELTRRVRTELGRLQGEAFSLGMRLYAERPRAFVARCEVYWRAWRATPVGGVTGVEW